MGRIDTGEKGAEVSDCGLYRYRLRRTWAEGRPLKLALWVMLNPSTADASADDPTIRRCVGFARWWGCDGIEVVNICAWRATSPRDLLQAIRDGKDVYGPGQDSALRGAVACAKDFGGPVVVGWGAWGRDPLVRPFRDRALLSMSGIRLQCLGLTSEGEPRHPLFVAAGTPLEICDLGGGE